MVNCHSSSWATARPVKPLEGPTLEILKVRNGVAHGDPAILASLGRLQVDAIKRHLALEAPEQALARLPRLDLA